MQTYVYQSRQATPKRVKKQHRRRKLAVISLLVVALYIVGSSLFIPLQIVAADNTSQIASNFKGEELGLGWPSTGQAAIGATNYGILASHNTEQVLPTASVIKTVMMLTVLQKHPLASGQSGPTITISQADVDLYNQYIAKHGSVMPVRVGQKLTLRQAFEAAMLRSANNVADMLATWAFGSMSAYRQYAQQYVESIGMTKTRIGTDASGFDPSTVSTASDLTRLGLVAIKNPALVEVAGLKSAVIPDVGTIKNTNNLLGREGIFGIKTGTDYQNKGSFLFASRYKPADGKTITIVGAVMGAPTSHASRGEVLGLLTSAQKGFATRTLYKAGDIVGTYKTSWADHRVQATVSKDVRVSGWRGTAVKTNITLDRLKTPAKAGAAIGTITYVTNGKSSTIGSVVLAQDLAGPSLWWRLTHPLQTIRFR